MCEPCFGTYIGKYSKTVSVIALRGRHRNELQESNAGELPIKQFAANGTLEGFVGTCDSAMGFQYSCLQIFNQVKNDRRTEKHFVGLF